MKIKTEVLPADKAESIAKAAELLRSGELVALPTETVYGIAADARNGDAVKKIFVAKGRPQDNPLIVHVTGPEMLPGLVSEVPERAQLLMAAFCPGPLTIIMPRGPEVAAECCAGLDTVGIRMPSHPVARAVIEQSGYAFAAPSANLSGKPSPTNAQDVFTDMDGRLPLILDGGECDVGVESTVVSVVGDKPTLFRPGHITLEDLERALGEEVEVSKAILEKLPEGAVVRSPGMKYKHYAPKADVTLLNGTFEQFKVYVDAHMDQNPSCLCFTGEAEKPVSYTHLDLYKGLEEEFGYKVDESEKGDLTTEAERLSYEWVKKHYGHEFLFITDYSAEKRAFYHMRDENGVPQGYDLIWRGVEITTGAQREHRYEVLKKQAEEKGLAEDVKFYLEFFQYGCPPHGGFGLGIDRLTMLLCGLSIKDAEFLFRGPNRLTP